MTAAVIGAAALPIFDCALDFSDIYWILISSIAFPNGFHDVFKRLTLFGSKHAGLPSNTLQLFSTFLAIYQQPAITGRLPSINSFD